CRRVLCLTVLLSLPLPDALPISLPASASGWQRLWKGFGVAALVIGVALVVGALSGGRDPLRPLAALSGGGAPLQAPVSWQRVARSEEHTSELQSLTNLVCRLLLE